MGEKKPTKVPKIPPYASPSTRRNASSATAARIFEEAIQMMLENADINTILAQIQHSLDKVVPPWYVQSTNAGETEAASSGEKEADDKAKEKGKKIAELLPAPPSSPRSACIALQEIVKKFEMIYPNAIPDHHAIEHSPEEVAAPPHEQSTDTREVEAESSEENETKRRAKEKGKQKLYED